MPELSNFREKRTKESHGCPRHTKKCAPEALNSLVRAITVLLMSTNLICPKCGGTDSYDSLQKRKRVPMCKQCSEVMYSPEVQLKQEKERKRSSILLIVIYVVAVIVVGTFVTLLFAPGP